MSNNLFVEIISPEATLFSGEAILIGLPGELGVFEVMKNHAPIISTLAKGKIKVKDLNGVISNYEISAGVIEVDNNSAKILITL